MHYDRITRVLHALLAIGILAQVLVSTVMIVPRPGRAENTWWEVHENLGLLLGIVLIVHWLWTLRRSVARGEGYLLFPWFSRAKLAAIRDDLFDTLADLRRGRLPDPGRPRPLPAALQSLGLILATALALSGTVIMLGMGEDGALPPALRTAREAHEIGGNLMWIYLVVHPLIAVVHELAGQPLIRRMFAFGPDA
jgi:cytochrome b561